MKFRYQPILLALHHPFRIATGMRTHTNAVLTQIQYEGLTGYGEAAMPPYYGENHDTAIAFLEAAKPIVQSISVDFTPSVVMDSIQAIAPGNHAAKAAIDLALHDLWAKFQGKSLWKIWGIDPTNMPSTSFTLGIDTPEVLAKKIEAAAEFNIIKVKLGSGDDQSIIKTIRSISDKPIYADANQGWTTKEAALDLIHWLDEQGVVLIEQPCPKGDLDSAAWISARSPLPIVADESFQRLGDLDTIANCFHGVNIKLMKCTGLAEGWAAIKAARAKNLKLMVGCMTETSCGIMGAAQIAPCCDYADLDGCWLISNNPFALPTLKYGKIQLPDTAGLGIELPYN